MASIHKLDGQYRVRYRITLPNGHCLDRSRRCDKLGQAKETKAAADVLESRTKLDDYDDQDIKQWIRLDLVSKNDAAQLKKYPDGRKTIKDAAEEYKSTMDCGLVEMTERKRRVDKMVVLFGPERTIDGFTFFDGEDIKKRLRQQGLKAVTCNKYLQDLKRLFTVQLAAGVIRHHPFGVSKGVKVPQSEKIKHSILSFEQIEMVLAAAEINDARLPTAKDTPGHPPLLGGKMVLFLLMFLGCGMRRSEAMAARWENIDWQQRKLHLAETKTDEDRDVGLGERLFALLKAEYGGKPGYILPRFNLRSVTRAIRRHFDRCGLPDVRLHDTRHTFITRMRDLGVSKRDVMARTGHKNATMHHHYDHPDFGEIHEDLLPFMTPKKL
jgi:integrase